MANINLLPWREAERRERNRATVVLCCAIWALAAFIVFLGNQIMSSRISVQNERNAYLQSEIRDLSRVIKEIDDLKVKRDLLLARMEVIQTLQSNRSQIVHIFDDLVTKLPNGVLYDSISKRDGMLKIGGRAQSNNRISALMRNLDSSEWFASTSLNVVDVDDRDGQTVSKFDVQVKEQKPDVQDDGIETVE